MKDIKRTLYETGKTIQNDINNELFLTDLELIMFEAKSDINKCIENWIDNGRTGDIVVESQTLKKYKERYER